MSYKLKEETKENIERTVGLTLEEMSKMDDDELQLYIENKTGKEIKWPEGAKVEGLKVITSKEVNKRMNKILKL